MRKTLCPLLAAIMILPVALTSCALSRNSEKDFSEDECRYTLDIVLRQATDSAIPALFMSLNNYDVSMVPSEFAFLDELRETIPGMDRLLDSWEEDVISFSLPYYDEFSTRLESLVDGIVFEDPVGLVRTGVSSLSEYFQKKYGELLSAGMRERLVGLDVSEWTKVAVQYNSWASSMDKLYGQDNPRIDVEMPYDEFITILSRHLVDVYIRTFRSYEVLIRTTPNPDMDPVVARVLDLE